LKPYLVMLCGKSGSGKDTFFKTIQTFYEQHNKKIVRLSVGDHVKLLATRFGWNGVKDVEGVKLLQKIGEKYNKICTDRTVEDAKIIMSNNKCDFVVTDHRYPYEHIALENVCRQFGWDYYRFKIVREAFTNYPEEDSRSKHKSETQIEEFKVNGILYNIENNPLSMVEKFLIAINRY